MAEMNLKGMLTKKLGPLPAWGWGLVIGGGYLGYRIISGRGISLTGSAQTIPEESAAGYSGPGSAGGSGSGGSWGDVPIHVVIDSPDPGSLNPNQPPKIRNGPIPHTDTGSLDPNQPPKIRTRPIPHHSTDPDLAAQLAASRKYSKRLKTRGDNWATWGKHWKNAAKHRPDTSGYKAPHKAGSTKPKTHNTGVTKHKGTQGTHILRPYRPPVIGRVQHGPVPHGPVSHNEGSGRKQPKQRSTKNG